MNIKNIIICTSVSVALAFAGSVALAPAVAEDAPAPEPTSVAPYDLPGWDERVAELNCEDWQVPGWLGADGLPTSCVNNEAVPGSHKGEPPAAPEPEPTQETAPAPVQEAPAPVTEPEPAPEPEPVCK